MKKNLLYYLLIAMCSVSLFASCSDDDEESFSGTYQGENLVLTVGGVEQTEKTVVLKGATLELNAIVPGEETTIVPINISEGKITGTDSNADRTVTVEGTVANGVLTAKVTLKMLSPLVGTWNIFDGNVTLKAEAPEGTKLYFLENEVDVATYQMILPLMMGSMPQAYLKDIIFKENGYLVANYAPDGNAGEKGWVASPENAVQWYVKDGQVYLLPNLGAIMTPKSESSNPLLDLLTNGMPVNFTIDETGSEKKLSVYVTREQMLPMMDILIPLVENMDTTGNMILGMMKIAIPEMKTTLESCTTFDLGMDLKEAK
ncbi:MAG: DUF4925 domain-containing protein [Bacteroides sp.]|nr:DUF4925 domain-containing protein [Bacteroides sp.]